MSFKFAETFEIFLEVVDITEITVCLLVNITEIQGAILPSYISIYILLGYIFIYISIYILPSNYIYIYIYMLLEIYIYQRDQFNQQPWTHAFIVETQKKVYRDPDHYLWSYTRNLALQLWSYLYYLPQYSLPL